MSGFFVAARNHLDLLGTLVSVFLTAFGGGVMRDVIVNKTPYTFSHDAPAVIVFTLMLLMILFRLLALSFVTAVGGGIARDIIINEVPFVFKTGFYGTVSLLAGAVLYLLEKFGWMNLYTITAVFVLGVALRIVAYYRKWSVPLV